MILHAVRCLCSTKLPSLQNVLTFWMSTKMTWQDLIYIDLHVLKSNFWKAEAWTLDRFTIIHVLLHLGLDLFYFDMDASEAEKTRVQHLHASQHPVASRCCVFQCSWKYLESCEVFSPESTANGAFTGRPSQKIEMWRLDSATCFCEGTNEERRTHFCIARWWRLRLGHGGCNQLTSIRCHRRPFDEQNLITVTVCSQSLKTTSTKVRNNWCLFV